MGDPDTYADVDLIVVIDDAAFDAVRNERFALVGRWATLVVGRDYGARQPSSCIRRARCCVYAVESIQEGIHMMVNEGWVDRALRGVTGVAALIVAFAAGTPTPVRIALFVVVLILLGTAATGVCPIYQIFGLRTNRPAPPHEAAESSYVRY